jgi:hypothetical protein
LQLNRQRVYGLLQRLLLLFNFPSHISQVITFSAFRVVKITNKPVECGLDKRRGK